MAIHIEVNQPHKTAFLLELLKSLDFVSSITTDDVVPVANDSAASKSFFEKHNGQIPHLDVKQFDNYVTNSRNEWERNIY